MSTYQTNGDKILQAVIADEQLIKSYGYNPDDYNSITDALDSDIVVIHAIAQIIYRNEQKATEKEIYNEVSNFLKSNI
jgi:hypothetical protein